MYDFSDASRRIIGRAQDESRRLGHPWLGTEHPTLALMSTDAPDVGSALGRLNITEGQRDNDLQREESLRPG